MDLDNGDDNDSNRPATPSQEDCCSSGCNPCVFDVHEKLMNEWRERKRQNVKIEIVKNILSPVSYKSFVVTNFTETCENCILIDLCYKDKDKTGTSLSLSLSPGQHVMLHSWSMSRPFTPISWRGTNLLVLVKIYENGRFSLRLKDMRVGDEIDIRGPYGDFRYKRNSFQQIAMFSIGSGIAAVYPIAKAIIDDELEETRMHLVAGFQSTSRIPLKKELQYLVDYWNFTCTLYISQSSDKIVNLHGFDVKNKRIDEASVRNLMKFNVDKTLILICGTSQFNWNIEKWVRKMNYSHIHIFE